MSSGAWRVAGRVQGVWFRGYTQQVARRLGLTGSAVNCSDGSVHVEAFGDEEALAKLQEALRVGPDLAEVESVTRLSAPSGRGPRDFVTG